MLFADYQQQGYGCRMTTLLIERLTEMTGRKNYYVLITREDLPELPYSIKEIYGIRTSGKYHFPEQIYHEFYQIYEDNTAGDFQ